MSSNKAKTFNINPVNVKDLLEPKDGDMLSVIKNFKDEPTAPTLPLDKLVSFKNRPYKVVHDASMDELIESIKIRGVIYPLIVRKRNDGLYEIISGHRRKYAAKQAGLTEVPCVIKDISDDDAIIMMVDYNKYREKILPSEKAFAYRMKLEAIKHQGRSISRQLVGKESADTLSNDESGRQVQRYIRLTYLIPELLNMVDADKLKFVMAVEISYLSEEMQGWLYEDVLRKQNVKLVQIASLRKHLEKNTMSREDLTRFFEPKTKPISTPKQISTAKISKFFPPHCGEKDIEKILEKVLNTTTAKKIIEELTGYNAEE